AGFGFAPVAAGDRRAVVDAVQLQAVAGEQGCRVRKGDVTEQQNGVRCGPDPGAHAGDVFGTSESIGSSGIRPLWERVVGARARRRSRPRLLPQDKVAPTGEGGRECAPREVFLQARRNQAVAGRSSGRATEMSSTSCSPSFTRSTLTASTSTLTYLRITSSSSRCSSGR